MFGHLKIKRSKIIPEKKSEVRVNAVGLIVNSVLNRFIHLNVDANSAVVNTAGITVEKLKVSNNEYSITEKCSFPTYTQLFRCSFSNSKSHQLGAEIRNNAMYSE